MDASGYFNKDLLQDMWEDSNTNKKWVTLTRCFFPDDLPESVGRPCAPESNEVKLLIQFGNHSSFPFIICYSIEL